MAYLKATRLTHLYLGVFAAPALLFFAFTGAIQTFSLHETTRGSSYQPPRILVILGQIHKKQTSVVPVHKASPAPEPAGLSKAGPPATAAAATAPAAAPAVRHNPLPLKIFFLLISISLLLSTFTGIVMAYKYTRRPAVVTALLVLGAVIPLLLLLV